MLTLIMGTWISLTDIQFLNQKYKSCFINYKNGESIRIFTTCDKIAKAINKEVNSINGKK